MVARIRALVVELRSSGGGLVVARARVLVVEWRLSGGGCQVAVGVAVERAVAVVVAVAKVVAVAVAVEWRSSGGDGLAAVAV